MHSRRTVPTNRSAFCHHIRPVCQLMAGMVRTVGVVTQAEADYDAAALGGRCGDVASFPGDLGEIIMVYPTERVRQHRAAR